jgi:hypothetical protein
MSIDVSKPGVVDAAAWRPEWPQVPRTERIAMILAGVGRTAEGPGTRQACARITR